MERFTSIVEVLSRIDFKKWLNRIVVVILGGVFILAFFIMIMSILQWGGECERSALYHLADPMFLYSFNVTITFFALAFLQAAAFLLVFFPVWKIIWFRISIAIALISYPTVFWILMKMCERMRP